MFHKPGMWIVQTTKNIIIVNYAVSVSVFSDMCQNKKTKVFSILHESKLGGEKYWRDIKYIDDLF